MKLLATLISFLLHPLLVLSYILVLMLAVNPFIFGARSLGDHRGVLLLISVFTTSFMIPALGVSLMKPLGLVRSLAMEDKQERIGPYIICGVFYLWLFKNFMGGPVPRIYAEFTLGATIGLFFAFFFNIFSKISAHAAGMAGFAAMVLILAYQWPGAGLALGGITLSMNVLFAVAVLLAGVAGYARLALHAHEPGDIWGGYGAGAGAVLLAHWIM